MPLTTDQFKRLHGHCSKITVPVPTNDKERNTVIVRCAEHNKAVMFSVDKTCCNPSKCMGGTCTEQPYACNH